MMRSAVSEHGSDEQEIQVVRVEKLEVAGTGAGSEVGAAASSRSSSSSSSTSDQEAEGSTQIVKKEGKKKRRKKKKVSNHEKCQIDLLGPKKICQQGPKPKEKCFNFLYATLKFY